VERFVIRRASRIAPSAAGGAVSHATVRTDPRTPSSEERVNTMNWVVVLLAVSLEGPALQTSLAGSSADATLRAETEQGVPAERGQLVLTLAPEDQVCELRGFPRWQDASDAFLFATGPTARHDEQELWATTLTSIATLRFGDGLLHLVVLDVPVLFPEPGLQFTFRGWRPRWPLC
jgi:hypothetical protein